jgi:hypothetical protein
MLIRMYEPSAEHLMQVCAMFCTLVAKISLNSIVVRERYSAASAAD